MSEHSSRSQLYVMLTGIISAIIASGTTAAVNESNNATLAKQSEITAEATRDAARIGAQATRDAAEIGARTPDRDRGCRR